MRKSIFGALVFSILAGAAIADGGYVYQMRLTGLGSVGSVPEPPGGTTQVDCSNSHCFALVGGEVYLVGELFNTQINTVWVETGMTGVSQVAAGSRFGYAIKDGEVFGIGVNSRGQLGLGNTDYQTEWQPTGFTGVSSVKAGDQHGYALKNGTVYSVGLNHYGQLGLDDNTDRSSWTETSLTGASQIATGSAAHFGYALVDGLVFSVGRNTRGQLGIGNTNDRNTWQSTGLGNVSAIAAGKDSGLAIQTGVVYGAGFNEHGQLGLGHNSNRSSWTASSLTDATQVAVGGDLSYAVANGNVYSTGLNFNTGGLGHGDFQDRNAWAQTPLSNVTDITGTIYGGMALTGDSDIYSVGNNNKGMLAIDAETSFTSSDWNLTIFPSLHE